MTNNLEKGLSIVIPVFNEEKNIGFTIKNIQDVMRRSGILYEVILVDDGSQDNTKDEIKKYTVSLIEHQFNKGYGASIKTGIKNAQYEHIAITDADGTYPHDKIPELFKHSDDFEMVVGARTGKEVHIPFIRKPAKWVLNKLANFLTDTTIPDLNSGLRIFRKDVVKQYFHILPSGFSFTTTITIALLSDDYNVKYVPIDYKKRVGRSKIKSRNAIDFFLLIIRTTIYFNPLKVFLPMSLICCIFTVLVLLYDVITGQGIYNKTVISFIFTMLIFIFGLIADLIVRRHE